MRRVDPAVCHGVEPGLPRVILVDVSDESRDVMARRLSAQGYSVEAAADPASGADLALSAPPAAVIADLWMPSISGVQLCRLLNAEPATAGVPVILRGPSDDPRSRFWAERAGAAAYVVKGRMGDLVRALSKAVQAAPQADGFFMQLSGGSIDVRDRIARHLDFALFESVIASEVRALASCGSFERLFDLFSQFLSQLMGYRWLAIATTQPEQFGLHHHPHDAAAEAEARSLLNVGASVRVERVADEDARHEESAPPLLVPIPFGPGNLGTMAMAPSRGADADTESLLALVAREIGGPIRIAALMDESQRLATIDPLTGLMNRRAFSSFMELEVARAARYQQPLSVMLLDVDHFKAVNDTYGHAAGDHVLSTIGSSLKTLVRTPDGPARWGGEEFVVALSCTGLQGAESAASRIRETISRLVLDHEGSELRVTVSIGVASLEPGETMQALIDRADRAMYAAKVAGRNRVVVAERPASKSPARRSNAPALLNSEPGVPVTQAASQENGRLP